MIYGVQGKFRVEWYSHLKIKDFLSFLPVLHCPRETPGMYKYCTNNYYAGVNNFILYSRELGSKGDPPLLLPQMQVAEAEATSGVYMYVCIVRKY